MDPLQQKTFPFITREMLKFGREMKIEIVVETRARVARNISISVVTRDGITLIPITTTAGGALAQVIRSVSDIPLLISAIDVTGNSEIGDVNISIYLRLNGQATYMLISGQIYQGKGISWPTSTVENVLPTGGHIIDINVTDPAAGGEILYTVPTNFVFMIKSMTFRLVTAATVAVRTVHFAVGNPSGYLQEFFGNSTQLASLTRRYTCTPVSAQAVQVDGSYIIIPIAPDIIIGQDFTIGTDTTNIQAADQFTAIYLHGIMYTAIST